MGHSCPDCGQMCYCGGDIDDCCFDFDEDVAQCSHCSDYIYRTCETCGGEFWDGGTSCTCEVESDICL